MNSTARPSDRLRRALLFVWPQLQWMILVGALSALVLAILYFARGHVQAAYTDLVVEKYDVFNNPSLYKEINPHNIDIRARIAKVTSRPVLGRVIDRLGLRDVSGGEVEAFSFLERNVRVSEKGDKSGVLTITVSTRDPQMNLKIADAVAEEYIRQEIEDMSYQARVVAEYLKLPKEKRHPAELIQAFPSVANDWTWKDLSAKKAEQEKVLARQVPDSPEWKLEQGEMERIKGRLWWRSAVLAESIGNAYQDSASRIARVLSPAYLSNDRSHMAKFLKDWVLLTGILMILLFALLQASDSSSGKDR